MAGCYDRVLATSSHGCYGDCHHHIVNDCRRRCSCWCVLVEDAILHHSDGSSLHLGVDHSFTTSTVADQLHPISHDSLALSSYGAIAGHHLATVDSSRAQEKKSTGSDLNF